MVVMLVRGGTGSFLVRSDRLRSGDGTKCPVTDYTWFIQLAN